MFLKDKKSYYQHFKSKLLFTKWMRNRFTVVSHVNRAGLDFSSRLSGTWIAVRPFTRLLAVFHAPQSCDLSNWNDDYSIFIESEYRLRQLIIFARCQCCTRKLHSQLYDAWKTARSLVNGLIVIHVQEGRDEKSMPAWFTCDTAVNRFRSRIFSFTFHASFTREK